MVESRVKFLKEVEVEDWYAYGAILKDYQIRDGFLLFYTDDTDFADELDKAHTVRVPLSNVQFIVTE